MLASGTGTAASAIAVTAVLSRGLLVLGRTAKEDLTKVGTYVMMGLMGLVMAMVVSRSLG